MKVHSRFGFDSARQAGGISLGPVGALPGVRIIRRDRTAVSVAPWPLSPPRSPRSRAYRRMPLCSVSSVTSPVVSAPTPARDDRDDPIISVLVLTCRSLSHRSTRPSRSGHLRVRRWTHRHRGCDHSNRQARRRPSGQGVRGRERHARREPGCPGGILAG